MTWFSKFTRLSPEEKKLFIEALFFLFYSKIFLFRPFRLCVKKLKPEESFSGDAAPEMLKKIRWAVARADKLSCWKNICLVKSFAARFMLQRRNIGSTMYLGLQIKNGKELAAHAWLIAGGVYITPKGSLKFKEIYTA